MRMTNDSNQGDKVDAEGWYQGQLTKFVTKKGDGSPLQKDPSKANFMMMIFDVTSGPFAGYEHAEVVSFNAFWKVKPLLEALGIDYEESDDGVDFDEDEACGGQVVFHIVRNGEYFNIKSDPQAPGVSGVLSIEQASELVADGTISVPGFGDEDEDEEDGDESESGSGSDLEY